MEECIPEEPCKIFLTVQDAVVNGNFFEEDLPEDELSDESTFPAVSTVIKEEIHLEPEYLNASLSASSTVIKEEFILELSNEQHADMVLNFLQTLCDNSNIIIILHIIVCNNLQKRIQSHKRIQKLMLLS